MARLFVAVWPPADVVKALKAMVRPDLPNLRWMGPQQWHLTLRFMGRVDDVDAAIAAFERIDAPATTATFGPKIGRFGDRVLHVAVEGLEELAAAVARATADIGEPPDPRPFRGHLTLARTRSRQRVDLRRLTGTIESVEWPVSSLTLVSSTTLPGGAVYEVLRRRELYSPGERP